MSPPVRAHLISLSLVLGLTVSLVWGQGPIHFSLSGVTVTGPLPITNVGIGTTESPSLICHTTDAINTVWLFPNGSRITQVLLRSDVTATDSFIFHREPTSNLVLLRRGRSVLSPGGDYCCGSAIYVNERLCINLVVDCEIPPSVVNGSPGTPTSTLIGETVTYTCNNGYQISPGVTMTTVSCLATGNWQTVPTCLAVDCGTPPSISNGSPGTPTKTTFEGTVTYTCSNGYQISPGVTMATASCVATGNWETVPTCLVVMCSTLSALDNGMITYSPTNSPTSVETMATYQCNVGYNRISVVATRTCSSNGVWSGEAPTCEAVDCGSPPSISNGYTGMPINTTFEGTVIYNCTDEYQISPGVTMTTASCLPTGNWETVTCLVMCPDLHSLMNGYITYQPAGTVQLEGTHAIYSCTSGYRLSGGPVRVCQSNRTWSVGNITCSAPPSSQSDNTGAIVGGVVILGLGLILAVTAIIIAYLVLKQRRMGGVDLKRDTPDIPLSTQGQSSPSQTYETVDVTYEEIDKPRPLKGNFKLSQCEAYASTTPSLRREGVVNV